MSEERKLILIDGHLYQVATEEEIEIRGGFIDERGNWIPKGKAPMPFIDLRYRPPLLFGDPPPDIVKKRCPKCGYEEARLIFPAHVNSDGIYHYPVYSCRRCGYHFGLPGEA